MITGLLSGNSRPQRRHAATVTALAASASSSSAASAAAATTAAAAAASGASGTGGAAAAAMPRLIDIDAEMEAISRLFGMQLQSPAYNMVQGPLLQMLIIQAAYTGHGQKPPRLRPTFARAWRQPTRPLATAPDTRRLARDRPPARRPPATLKAREASPRCLGAEARLPHLWLALWCLPPRSPTPLIMLTPYESSCRGRYMKAAGLQQMAAMETLMRENFFTASISALVPGVGLMLAAGGGLKTLLRRLRSRLRSRRSLIKQLRTTLRDVERLLVASLSRHGAAPRDGDDGDGDDDGGGDGRGDGDSSDGRGSRGGDGGRDGAVGRGSRLVEIESGLLVISVHSLRQALEKYRVLLAPGERQSFVEVRVKEASK